MSPIAYRLTVSRGARAGFVRTYEISPTRTAQKAQRSARAFADHIDLEYGAICAHVATVYPEA